MRYVLFGLFAGLLLVWTFVVVWIKFGGVTVDSFGIKLASAAFIWCIVGIPLSVLALVFKPR